MRSASDVIISVFQFSKVGDSYACAQNDKIDVGDSYAYVKITNFLSVRVGNDAVLN